MDLTVSKALVPGLIYRHEVGSTNAELVRLASGASAAEWPNLSVLVTDNQTAGRGRLDRSWVTSAGKALAISVLLRPLDPAGAGLEVNRYGWFPLIAGLAMSRAVTSASQAAAIDSSIRGVIDGHVDNVIDELEVGLKWPNDVLIGGKKVSGILCELLPDATGVVIGAGINLTQSADELPTPTSTSLMASGVFGTSPDAILAAYLAELIELCDLFTRSGGDAQASGIRDAVTDACDTLGRDVRVHLPAGDELLGTAADIDVDGQIVINRSSDGQLVTVAAGDVAHLRY